MSSFTVCSVAQAHCLSFRFRLFRLISRITQFWSEKGRIEKVGKGCKSGALQCGPAALPPVFQRHRLFNVVTIAINVDRDREDQAGEDEWNVEYVHCPLLAQRKFVAQEGVGLSAVGQLECEIQYHHEGCHEEPDDAYRLKPLSHIDLATEEEVSPHYLGSEADGCNEHLEQLSSGHCSALPCRVSILPKCASEMFPPQQNNIILA